MVQHVGHPFDRHNYHQTHGIAWTNYAASEGYHWWTTASLTLGNTAGDYSGVFTIEQCNRVADIVDGTSNTVEVDDSGAKTNKWFRSGPYAFSPTFITYYGPNSEWPGVSSYHPSIIQATLGDGSVRSIRETIEWEVWVAINGIKDGYVVSKEF